MVTTIGVDEFEWQVRNLDRRYYSKYQAYLGLNWLDQNLATGETQSLERLGAGYFVHQLQINVKNRLLTGFRVNAKSRKSPS